MSTDSFLTWIRERIEERGPATVAQFMEWALYHPQYGYYSGGPSIGPRGDFTTSPEASRAFGHNDVPGGLAGALIANEVLDAFPVHVLENRDGAILEQYVGIGQSTDLRIAYGPPSRPELLDFLERYRIDLRPGQRVEVNLA